MGLIFALQPDLRLSAPGKLVLTSSKRRFSLGGGLLFGAALLGTMYLAASPLFKLLWNEGALFDQILTAGIYGSIILYPILAVFCWFFKEVAILESNPKPGTIELHAYNSFLGFKWNHRRAQKLKAEDFEVGNWKGALNMAGLKATASGQRDRYATAGYWLLRTPPNSGSLRLERRAKRDDVELLKEQILAFFRDPSSQAILDATR